MTYQIVAGETCAVYRQIYFRAVDSSLSAKTSLSISAGNLGIMVGQTSFTSCAGTVSALPRGIYIYTPVVAEVSILGPGILVGDYSGVLDFNATFQVVTSIAVTTNGRVEAVATFGTSAISAGAVDSTTFAQIASVVAASILTTPSQKVVTNASGFVGAYVFSGSLSTTNFATSALSEVAFETSVYRKIASVVAASILTTPSQKLVTDSNGYVGVYTLGTTALSATNFGTSIFGETTYNVSVFGRVASVVAASILATPSQKLATNASGFVGIYQLATSVISATTFQNSAIHAAVLPSATYEAIADNFIGRNIDGGSSTGRTVRQALAVLRNRVDLTGTGSSRTLTIYDTGDTSAVFTVSVGLSARDSFQTYDPA